DGTLVDPEAPETLIYSQTARDTFVLIGVMFTAEKKDPPAVYEPYLRWHLHEGCREGRQKLKETKDGSCPGDAKPTRSGYMTHVWFVSTDDLVHAFAMNPPRQAIMAYQKSLT
ncbi:MAG: hypothetical protein QOJ72_2744, partial [Nocardioidaceae bacterium]|nr:hypothetical protein [Nocardioidaceae bacterium]